jgi:hypothetical protein
MHLKRVRKFRINQYQKIFIYKADDDDDDDDDDVT